MSKYGFIYLLVSCSCILSAQFNPWTSVEPKQINQDKSELQQHIEVEQYWSLDDKVLNKILTTARSESTKITVPLSDGAFATFVVRPNQLVPKVLVQKYPDLITLSGHQEDNPKVKIFIDRTHLGFHAMITGNGPNIYIDPIGITSDKYQSYTKRQFKETSLKNRGWRCDTDQNLQKQDFSILHKEDHMPKSIDAMLSYQEYRCAIAVSAEYTEVFGGDLVDGLAAVVTAMNRVSGVYETEMGIRFVLVDMQDQLIYTDAKKDPFRNKVSDLYRIQDVIDDVIGTDNYDIGHLFLRVSGGAAIFESACQDDSKAQGLTGQDIPYGDPFFIDYVAHEIGHQFGASHTFNGNENNCVLNRAEDSAYEPGSGSTIMGYAGICGNVDLQNNSDDYFHLRSLRQISTYTAGLTCPTIVESDNHYPTVQANSHDIDGKYIPAETPFELIGSGADADGDELTFVWEQWDLGAQTGLDNDDGFGPLMRSIPPRSDAKRVFPVLQDILTGTNTLGYQLPTTDRAMHFQLVARDQLGAWAHDSIVVYVVKGQGPFKVTSHNDGVVISDTTTIKWDVSGTASSPINCQGVDIRMSYDGGYTFSQELATNVDNDGAHLVFLPDGDFGQIRFKVGCSDNIFFDISDADLSISPVTNPCNVEGLISVDTLISGYYRSNDTLMSDGLVMSTNDVIFSAKNQIHLLPHFVIQNESIFKAFIRPCTTD